LLHHQTATGVLVLSFMGLSRVAHSLAVLLLFILSVPGLGGTSGKEVVHGYLVDLVCVREEVGRISQLGPNHTRKCLNMPACIQGGYAVLLPSNQVLALDAHGNELAKKWLVSHRQEKGIKIKASGTRDGDTFHVVRIE
jgi:hypothetical protein